MVKVSITLRPLIEDFESWEKADCVSMLISKMSKGEYVVSKEKGGSEVINHYQIYYNGPEKKVKTVREKLKRLFLKKFQYDLSGVCCKFNQVKVFNGYNLKEVDISNDMGKLLFSNMSVDSLLAVQQQYFKDNKPNNDTYKVNRKNYHIHIERFIKSHSKYSNIDVWDCINIKDVIGGMIDKGYYMTFINKRNYREIVMYVCSYLNKTGKAMVDEWEFESDKIKEIDQLRYENIKNGFC